MKIKMNFKLLLMFAIILGAIFLVGTNKVEAKTFEYEYIAEHTDKIKVVIEAENKNLIQTEYINGVLEEQIKIENIGDIVGVEDNISYRNGIIMTQEDINKFNTSRDLKYTIKRKVSNDVTSAKTKDGKEIEIQKENNNTWLTYEGTMHYEAINETKGTHIVGYKNNDISKVEIGNEIEYLKNETSDSGCIVFYMYLVTEKLANQNLFIQSNFINKNNCIEYEHDRIIDISIRHNMLENKPNHYQMLNPIYSTDANKYAKDVVTYGNEVDICKLPTDVNTDEVYLSIWIKENYQGEKIELENNKGTLYFKEKKYKTYTDYDKVNYYIYEGKLSDLKFKENEVGLIKFKLKDGSEVQNYIRCCYKYDKNTKEKVIDFSNKTKREQNIENKVKVEYYEKYEGATSKFSIAKIEKDNVFYNSMKNELDKKSINYDNLIYLDIIDVYAEYGDICGETTLTFNIGEQYNGKYYNIVHRVRYNEFENFEGVVENGKIKITTDSLSPFGISIYENKATKNEDINNNKQEDKGKKDNTPKTGNEDIVGYIGFITIISMIVAIIIKKKLN